MASLDLTGCTFLSTAASKALALTDLDNFLAQFAPITANERLRAAAYADETVRTGFWNAVKSDLAIRAVAPTVPAGGGSYTAIYALDVPPDLAGRIAAIRQGIGFSA